jgi:methyl-accepting chemotaxis protein
MPSFEQLNAKTKVLLGFLLLSVFTAVVGYIGLSNTQKLSDEINTLYERDFLGLAEIREAHVQLLHISRLSRQVILDKKPEDVQKTQRAIETNATIVFQKLKEATPKMATEEGRRNAIAAQTYFEKYLERRLV